QMLIQGQTMFEPTQTNQKQAQPTCASTIDAPAAMSSYDFGPGPQRPDCGHGDTQQQALQPGAGDDGTGLQIKALALEISPEFFTPHAGAIDLDSSLRIRDIGQQVPRLAIAAGPIQHQMRRTEGIFQHDLNISPVAQLTA